MIWISNTNKIDVGQCGLSVTRQGSILRCAEFIKFLDRESPSAAKQRFVFVMNPDARQSPGCLFDSDDAVQNALFLIV